MIFPGLVWLKSSYQYYTSPTSFIVCYYPYPGEVRKETLQATRGAGNKESKQGSLHAVHWKQEEEGKEEQGTRSCSG